MSSKDAMSASLIRRPTGAAPTSRAAATFQRKDMDVQPPATETQMTAQADGPQQRTTVVYPVALKRGLKTTAAKLDASMSGLVRSAVTAAMQDRAAVVSAAPRYQGVSGTRTTVDLLADQHKTLNVWAAQEGTTANALILAAIYQAYPDIEK